MFDNSPLSLLGLLNKMREHDQEHINELAQLTTHVHP